MLVEVWSDVVCPWCAIGRARLGDALERLAADGVDDVDVRWRSFELDPNRPATTDVDYVSFLAAKYRTSAAQAQEMIDRMTEAGAEAGVEFRFDRARPGNTFDAHRLLHLAAERGRQDEVKARFLAGYHTEGEPIADHGALTRLATDAGLDEAEVTEVLGSDRYAGDVRRDQAQAYEYGVGGVPFFVVDGRVGVSGAQPAEVLVRAVAQARELAAEQPTGEDAPATADHHGHPHAPGEQCVEGVCAV